MIQTVPWTQHDAQTRSATPDASELIARYPQLSENELTRLINLYREMPALDAALMISDEALGPKLDRFVKDHRKRIRTPFRQYAALAMTAVLGLTMTAWAVVTGF